MTWSAIEAIDYCLTEAKFEAIAPKLDRVEQLEPKIKSVVFRFAQELEIAIPVQRKDVVTCYVPSHSMTGDALPDDIATIHPGLALRIRYPRADGLLIAGSVLRNAPSLHPSRSPALLGVNSRDALASLVLWLTGKKGKAAPILASASYTYAEIQPVITRLIGMLGAEHWVTVDVLAEAMLSDAEGSALVTTARAINPFGEAKQVASSMIALFSKFSHLAGPDIDRGEFSGKTAYRVRRDSEQDIQTILDDPEIPATDKRQLILARVGQGKFRDAVIQTWGLGLRCAVTGVAVRPLLIASHIVAWSKNKDLRLHGTNGIILGAHLDKLFDAHLISFDSEGSLIFSSSLDAPARDDLASLGVYAGMSLNLSGLSSGDKKTILSRLAEHRASMDIVPMHEGPPLMASSMECVAND